MPAKAILRGAAAASCSLSPRSAAPPPLTGMDMVPSTADRWRGCMSDRIAAA
jgi:hypothetical protein